jgi:hypothetical protein
MKLQASEVKCLVLDLHSGVYYARTRVDGRLYIRSLRERSFSEARQRLPDKLRDIRELDAAARSIPRAVPEMTFGTAAETYVANFESNPRLEPGGKSRPEHSIEAARRVSFEPLFIAPFSVIHEDQPTLSRADQPRRQRIRTDHVTPLAKRFASCRTD